MRTQARERNDKTKRISEHEPISYSAIATFQACPLRWYYRYALGLREETVSASRVFGTASHAALQKHFELLLAWRGTPVFGRSAAGILDWVRLDLMTLLQGTQSHFEYLDSIS